MARKVIMADKIFSPMPSLPSISTSGGAGKGGDPQGPFGAYKQSGSMLSIVTRDTIPTPSQGTQGGLTTPMDTSPSMGITGGSPGMGGQSGGICSPMEQFIKNKI